MSKRGASLGLILSVCFGGSIVLSNGVTCEACNMAENEWLTGGYFTLLIGVISFHL